jgi:hypothetical protein
VALSGEARIGLDPTLIGADDRVVESSSNTNVSAESIADTQIVIECAAAGRPVPVEVARRVQARAAQARKQLLATHGVQDIGVEIIREIRGELPQK